jgi:hypothetical protein
MALAMAPAIKPMTMYPIMVPMPATLQRKQGTAGIAQG